MLQLCAARGCFWCLSSLLLLSALRELKECSSSKWSSGSGLATPGLSEAWERRVAELKERFTQLPVQVSQARGLVEGVKAKFFRRIGNVCKVGNLGTQEANGDVTKKIIKVQ